MEEEFAVIHTDICLFLAKVQSVKRKRFVVVELVNAPMTQDISFQIFGGGGNKLTKDQA